MPYYIAIVFVCVVISFESQAIPTTQKKGLPIGVVSLYAGLSVPENWLRCDGSNISRTAYAKLFAVIGTLYGVGDNVNTFNLPDFQGRFPFGINNKEKSGFSSGGESKHSLTEDELPEHRHDTGSFHLTRTGDHTHNYTDPGHNHGTSTGEAFVNNGQYWLDYHGGGAGLGQHSHSIPVGTTGITVQSSGEHSHALQGSSGSIGKGKAFSLLPPFQTIDFIILYQ